MTLPFSKNFRNQDFELNFFKMQQFQYFVMILIGLITDDVFVLAVMANMYFMVHLVYLFMKLYLTSIVAGYVF